MRAFVAVPCPPRLGAAMAEALGRWRGKGAGIRWSDPAKIHLTLRFLGDDADPGRLERLAAGLERAAAAGRPLAVRPDATGAFPGWGRPRVLWLGLADEGGLADLAGQVEEAARQAGFPAEERAFKPHVTLGRVKDRDGLDEVLGDLREWRPDTGAETLEELIVYRSELGPEGARHEPIGRHRLGGGGRSVRILHLADIHLGAPLGNFGSYAVRRRDDLEEAFRRAIAAALEERVQIVLIAGDLFDTHRPDTRAIDLARRELARLREADIRVLAVPGTHDSLLRPDSVYRRENLPFDRLFEAPSFADPERVETGGAVVWVYGIACDPRRQRAGWDTLARVPDEGIHIALAHAACRDRPDWTIAAEDLPFEEKDLLDLGMDYVALGHYHNQRVFEAEGGRILGAYPGSIEGRDWTETGPRHALLVQFDPGSQGPSLRPIPVHSRILETCELNVGGAASEAEVCELLRERCAREKLWQVVLVGEPEAPLRSEAIGADLEAAYGHIQVVDATTLVTSRYVAELCQEPTVRGEFFRRLVQARERATDDRERRVADRAVKLGVRVFG